MQQKKNKEKQKNSGGKLAAAAFFFGFILSQHSDFRTGMLRSDQTKTGEGVIWFYAS